MDSAHFLALKVMRLTRPTFVIDNPLPISDQPDLLFGNQQQQQQLHQQLQQQQQQINLSEMLSLPQNFGSIYLGETFAAYVSVHNDCNHLCRDIIVKADLQTNSTKVSMTSASAEPVSELPPDRSIDSVLTHEVKELGPHILVCTVSYTSHSAEKLYFKKYFKFQVQRPLDVKTDFRTTDNGDLFLEAKIQNITAAPIFLEKVFLEPSPAFQLIASPVPSKQCTDTRLPDCLRESEIRQFLYRLRHQLPAAAAEQQQQLQQLQQQQQQQPAVTAVTVGKLDITWRSQMGQRARLQTSPLTTTLPPSDEIRLTVEQVPAEAKLNHEFEILCRVTNHCNRSVQLKLSTNQTAANNNNINNNSSNNSSNKSNNQNNEAYGLLFCGKVVRDLRSLSPGDSVCISLSLMPLLPGLQPVSGLLLTDSLLRRSFEFDEVAQVLVLP